MSCKLNKTLIKTSKNIKFNTNKTLCKTNIFRIKQFVNTFYL